MIRAELGSQFRIAGIIRTPDREGALAHLDTGRGFALVARGSMGPNDVVEPTIWVKEKISLALSATSDPADPPLRRVIRALRALHAELMSRPQAERPWVAVLILLLRGEDAVAISAGDPPCFRFRSGLLSRLGRAEADPGAHAPHGALGSESQVRIEVVPLRPQPGDLYILSTRTLRDGELAVLARDLTTARDGPLLLRMGVEGATDRGRIAIRILEPLETEAIAQAADSRQITRESVIDLPDKSENVPDEPYLDLILGDVPDDLGAEGGFVEGDLSAIEPGIERKEAAPPIEIDGMKALGLSPDELLMETTDSGSGCLPTDSLPEDSRRLSETRPPGTSADGRRRPDSLARVGEGRPWYEPLALWGGGALAFVALAILVRSLLPGILGSDRHRSSEQAAAVAATGLADIFSEPPGAIVRVDGDALEGRTPLAGVPIAVGIHRIELDWGAYGVWRDTVEIAHDTRLTIHPALLGTVTLRSSEPARVLDVYLDGVYVGTTPLKLDTVGIGRHLVRFGGPGLATSAQEVEVLRDAPVELVGSPGPPPERGKITIRTAILGDSGFEAGKGDPYWIDGVARGATPGTVDLDPGTHSVRVIRRGFPPQISILDVKAGGEHFVTAEFGARSEEPIRFNPPEALSLSNPTPLTLAIPPSEWDPSVSLWLYVAAPGGSFQAKRMTRLEEGTRTFAALPPPEVLQNSAHRVRLYFKATGTAGRETYSEIFTIPVRD